MDIEKFWMSIFRTGLKFTMLNLLIIVCASTAFSDELRRWNSGRDYRTSITGSPWHINQTSTRSEDLAASWKLRRWRTEERRTQVFQDSVLRTLRYIGGPSQGSYGGYLPTLSRRICRTGEAFIYCRRG